jgi:hypothetical protein
MQTYTQTVAANYTWVMNIPGKYFVTLGCTNTLNVRFYKGGKKLDLGDISGLGQGLEVGPLAGLNDDNAFDRVEIDITGPDTVKIGIGNGAARYNNSLATVVVTSNTPPRTGSITNTLNTVTNASAQLLAAKVNRSYLLIQNKDTTGNVFINFGAAATVANGIKIQPLGVFEMSDVQATQAIYAIGDVASNANVLTVEG